MRSTGILQPSENRLWAAFVSVHGIPSACPSSCLLTLACSVGWLRGGTSHLFLATQVPLCDHRPCFCDDLNFHLGKALRFTNKRLPCAMISLKAVASMWISLTFCCVYEEMEAQGVTIYDLLQVTVLVSHRTRILFLSLQTVCHSPPDHWSS